MPCKHLQMEPHQISINILTTSKSSHNIYIAAESIDFCNFWHKLYQILPDWTVHFHFCRYVHISNHFLVTMYCSTFPTGSWSRTCRIATYWVCEKFWNRGAMSKGNTPGNIWTKILHDSLFQGCVRITWNQIQKFYQLKLTYRTVANVTHQIKITNGINFRNVLKVARNSTYFPKIKRLLRMYNENGVLELIFKEIHQRSYRLVVPIQR